jgi:hypothetical protein
MDRTEIERVALSEDEARIVAYLRAEAEMRDRLADEHPTIGGIKYNKHRAIALHMALEAIERGEHRKAST